MSPSNLSLSNKELLYSYILNPLAWQKLSWDFIPLMERPASLAGKTVYIINQRWGGNVPDFTLKVLDNVEPEDGALVLLTPLS
jgi:hypothetical protein